MGCRIDVINVFGGILFFFLAFCLVVKRNLVTLQAEKGVTTICTPDYINVNKIKISRNALNLNLLRFALRKIFIQKHRFRVDETLF